ncbi:hypothetical protein KUTeg_013585 [Tegillarca granosa]|uniref:Trafficking protein particle complex subunit 6B n=1 Tax=Tegillarca granosa TaxID=220873 RepID=A0ABQ9EXL6_TEGGR|nr:hypothetical protein KUTeg_013585 [Tegillarca granosa]
MYAIRISGAPTVGGISKEENPRPIQHGGRGSVRDNCIAKLESLGFRVGQSLVERFTKDSSRFKDELDTMKFICKDFWNSVYKKQIDNLRTNHQSPSCELFPFGYLHCFEIVLQLLLLGVYVLQDNKFRFLTQLSNGKQYMDSAPMYLAFPCGMIRGALSNLGINCIVTAEVSAMPAYLDTCSAVQYEL